MTSEKDRKQYKSPYLESRIKQKYTPRDCLACGETFLSVGPQNRMCNYCRRCKWIDNSDDLRIIGIGTV